MRKYHELVAFIQEHGKQPSSSKEFSRREIALYQWVQKTKKKAASDFGKKLEYGVWIWKAGLRSMNLNGWKRRGCWMLSARGKGEN
jgi:hypothetical protein